MPVPFKDKHKANKGSQRLAYFHDYNNVQHGQTEIKLTENLANPRPRK